MKNLKVALLQITPEKSLEGNLQKGLEYCKKSKEIGADIALFPEMWKSQKIVLYIKSIIIIKMIFLNNQSVKVILI